MHLGTMTSMQAAVLVVDGHDEGNEAAGRERRVVGGCANQQGQQRNGRGESSE